MHITENFELHVATYIRNVPIELSHFLHHICFLRFVAGISKNQCKSTENASPLVKPFIMIFIKHKNFFLNELTFYSFLALAGVTQSPAVIAKVIPENQSFDKDYAGQS